MKYLYLLTLIFILICSNSNKVSACNCTTTGPFLKVTMTAKLIVEVEIKDYTSFEKRMGKNVPRSMSLKIKTVLKGIEPRKEITVWGNDGSMYSPYLDVFKKGTTWVMALNDAPTKVYENAKIEDYGISNCGEQFMKSKKGIAQGLIRSNHKHELMPIAELKESIEIINRNNDKIDLAKKELLQQLYDFDVDTIGVFEQYDLNNNIHDVHLKASHKMIQKDIYPDFHQYIQEMNINRQIFVFWQSQGKIYVKQIDCLFNYDAIEISNSLFFSTYNEYYKWLITEELLLPEFEHKEEVKEVINPPNAFALNKNNTLKGASLINKNISKTYPLQSFQMFVGQSIFIKDFDISLFEELYNPDFYEKNQETLSFDWLSIVRNETEIITAKNEETSNLLKEYKKLILELKLN